MKIKGVHKYIFPIILVVFLCIYAAWRLTNDDNQMTSSTLDIDRSFVWVNSDSLEMNLIKSYQKWGLKVSNRERKFIVEYPSKTEILVSATGEGVKANLDSLKLKAPKYFECKEVENKIVITLEKDDDFVYCPTLLLRPLLDDNKSN